MEIWILACGIASGFLLGFGAGWFHGIMKERSRWNDLIWKERHKEP